MLLKRGFSSSSVSRRNFYDVLQLRENADRKSIKANYYKLSKKYHPDLNPNNKEAHKLFLEINEAYAVLGNEASKRRYDSDRTESSSNASRWSRTTGGGSNTQAWQHFRNRRARSTGSSSAKEQAEKMGRHATAGGGFNYNEHYSRHYAAEEHKRRERMANAAKRRKEAGDETVIGERAPEMQNLWGRLWRLGIVLTGIAYATQAFS